MYTASSKVLKFWTFLIHETMERNSVVFFKKNGTPTLAERELLCESEGGVEACDWVNRGGVELVSLQGLWGLEHVQQFVDPPSSYRGQVSGQHHHWQLHPEWMNEWMKEQRISVSFQLPSSLYSLMQRCKWVTYVRPMTHATHRSSDPWPITWFKNVLLGKLNFKARFL